MEAEKADLTQGRRIVVLRGREGRGGRWREDGSQAQGHIWKGEIPVMLCGTVG